MKTRPGIGTETLHDVAIGDTVAASDPDLRPSAPSLGTRSAAASDPARGDSIGRFIVLGVLGSGGMGVVYSAYDPHLDRKVAIKLLANTQSGDAAVRLLREAQAMAKINHPNVIKVHEVGTFDDQVFVAMEFADAGTLRGWLKQATRSQAEILDVFASAGRGLGAAHAAGLVHRDFKPDNVLISSDGSIRVTDFGLVSVADAPPPRAADVRAPTDQPLGNDTPLSQDLTRTGSILGTPTYMAPEQFSGRGSTPRTDQFAFCIALYEALYGERPFVGENYQQLSAAVLLGEIAPAPKGASVPPWLRRVLLRGLSTEPAERYPSMSALLGELQRDPRRRRRTWLLAGAGACALAGVATVAVLATKRDSAECKGGGERFAKIWNADQRAKIKSAFDATKRPHAAATFTRLTALVDDWGARWGTSYVDACEDTRVRGEQSERLLDLRMLCLTRQLDDAKATLDLIAAGGPDVADKALSAALALPTQAACEDTQALTAAVAPPTSDAMRLQVAGARSLLDDARAERRLGRYAKGREIARNAVEVARTSAYSPVVGEALLVRGMLENDVADKASVATLRDAMRTAAAAGDTATMLDASAWLTFALTNDTDQYALASEIGSLADAVAQHDKPPPETAVRLQTVIALLDAKLGKVDAAQARYESALAQAKAELGPDHPGTMTTLTQLGNLAKQRGKFADARKYLEGVLASREKVLGKDHPDIASALNNLGNVYRVEGNLKEAKQLYERALAIRVAALGANHPDVGTSYNNLGTFYADAGDNEKAEEYARKALANWEAVYGKDHIEVTAAIMNLGAALAAQGKRPAAREQYDRARKIMEAAKGPEHPDIAGVIGNIGVLALEDKQLDEAEKLFKQAEQIARKAYGPDHPDVADYMANITTVYKNQGKLREAKEMTSRTLGVIAKAYGPDHPRMGGALVNYGVLQIRLEDRAGAIETFKRALAIFEAKLGGQHPYVAYALNGIGGTLIEMDKHAEAVPYLERALAIRVDTKQAPGEIGESRYNLAQALGAAPATRARAREIAKAALADYTEAGDAEQVKEVQAWLRKH